jgi:N-(5-amino-5-carboxypentanoyl)-L-cysteinyl-D-valine synthase
MFSISLKSCRSKSASARTLQIEIPFTMSIVIHHINFDGWSWSIFQRDLKEFYDFYEKASTTLNLPLLKA